MGLFDKFMPKTENRDLFQETTKFGSLKIDEKNKLFKIGMNIFDFEDLVSYELIEDKEVITQGGVSIGRALGGGALFGDTGTAVGALSKIKKTDKQYCTNLQILYTVKNSRVGAKTIMFIGLKTDKSKAMYKQAMLNAKSTIAGFDFIISSNVPEADNAVSNFDDLKKLKELLDMGILTQEEFHAKKKKILDL